jgi:hypothetical protein
LTRVQNSTEPESEYEMSKFFGVVPPVVIPLADDHSVDYDSYTRVLEHLIEGGCHGLFALGSTSEVVFYDGAERRRILEHTVKVANGRVPVIAGVMQKPRRMLAPMRSSSPLPSTQSPASPKSSIISVWCAMRSIFR